MSDSIRRIAAELVGLRKDVLHLQTATRAGQTSIEYGGSIDEYHPVTGELLSRTGTQHDGTHGAQILSGPVPLPPTQPVVEASLDGLTVSWDGRLSADGTPTVQPLDFAAVEILLASGRAPVATDLVGAIVSPAGGQKVITVPAGEWWVCLRTRTVPGRTSALTLPVVVVVESVTSRIDAAIVEAVAGVDETMAELDERLDAAFQVGGDAAALAQDAMTAAGGAITGSVVQYAVGSSETVAPASGWSTATPVRTPGSFVWMRTVVTYGDASTATTSPVLVTGNAGAPGAAGSPGLPGAPGATTYTWLKYADTPTTGMSDSPAGKTYMGLAHNKTSAAESSVYADYSWSLIKGTDGVPGAPGANGVTTYTWIKYATSATGAGMSDLPDGRDYIGLAHNKTTATESTIAADYTWSLIKGEVGATGATGVGVSSVTPYYRTTAAAAAAPAVPTTSTPPSPWATTEPTYVADTALWRTDRVVYTNSTFAYTPVTRVSSYAAAVAAMAAAQAATTAAASAGSDAQAANAAALAAAGVAGSKGEVIYQASAPTGARASSANLWIRTSDNKPHTYNGSGWVAVESKIATDAAAAAASAASAAATAQSAANAAATAAANADTKAVGAAAAASNAQGAADAANAAAASARAAADQALAAAENLWPWTSQWWSGANITQSATQMVYDGLGGATSNNNNRIGAPAKPVPARTYRLIATVSNATTTQARLQLGGYRTLGQTYVSSIWPTGHVRPIPAGADRMVTTQDVVVTYPAGTDSFQPIGYCLDGVALTIHEIRVIDVTDLLVAETAAANAASAAATAQARADAAHTLAGSALANANAAIASANARNAMYRSTAAPSGTADRVGDMWWRFSTTAFTQVIGTWMWSGSSWVQSQMAHQVISSVDIGSLTVVGTAVLAQAVIDFLWANVVAAKKITADMLVVGSGANLIPDPNFEDLANSWIGIKEPYSVGVDPALGRYLIADATIGTGWREIRHGKMSVTPGQVIRLKAKTRTVGTINGSGVRFGYYAWAPDGTTRVTAGLPTQLIPASAGWTERVWDWTIPDGVAYISAFPAISSTATTGVAHMAAVEMKVADAASLIVDGAVLARHIDVLSLTGATAFIEQVQAMGIKLVNAQGETIVNLTGTGEQTIGVLGPGGALVAGMDSAGNVIGKTVVANDGLRVAGRDIGDLIGERIRVVGRGEVNIGSAGGQSLRSMTGLMTATATTIAGNRYRATFQPPAFQVYTPDGQVLFDLAIKYGASISLSSQVLLKRWRSQYRPSIENTLQPFQIEWTASNTGLLSLLTAMGFSSGNVNENCDVWGTTTITVEDLGPDIPNTGVNTRAGGAWFVASNPTPTPPPPVPEKRTYDKYYAASSFKSFLGTGNPTPNAIGLQYAMQGRSPAYTATGAQSSHIYFPWSTIRSDIAGSTIEAVAVYVHNAHTYANAGGTVRLAWHGYGSDASSAGTMTHLGDFPIARGEGKWIWLPASVGDLFKSSAAGIAFSAFGSTSAEYYAYFHALNSQIFIRYTK